MSKEVSAQTEVPDFVFTGFKRPKGGYRLYACRDIPAGAEFGQSERDFKVLWTLRVHGMTNMLVIDAATPGEAMAKAFEIWGNADRQAELENFSRRVQLTRKVSGGGKP